MLVAAEQTFLVAAERTVKSVNSTVNVLIDEFFQEILSVEI